MILKLVYLSILLYQIVGFGPPKLPYRIPEKPPPNIVEYKPKYSTIGNWNLKGTSVDELNNVDINLEIVPRKNLKNLTVNLTKLKNVGPICYKDSLNGIVFCKRESENEGNIEYSYKFKPNIYSISIITICGVEIPEITNNKKKVNNSLKIDNINWHQQNDLLFVNINNDYYVFQRNLSEKESIEMIKLDKFVMSQFLGYICFKCIDHFHFLKF